MSILDIFRLGKKTASTAKDRLQIVVSHQRALGSGSQADFLPKLRQELMTVISKYTNIEQDKIQVQLQEEGEFSVLELNITLPSVAGS